MHTANPPAIGCDRQVEIERMIAQSAVLLNQAMDHGKGPLPMLQFLTAAYMRDVLTLLPESMPIGVTAGRIESRSD